MYVTSKWYDSDPYDLVIGFYEAFLPPNLFLDTLSLVMEAIARNLFPQLFSISTTQFDEW